MAFNTPVVDRAAAGGASQGTREPSVARDKKSQSIVPGSTRTAVSAPSDVPRTSASRSISRRTGAAAEAQKREWEANRAFMRHGIPERLMLPLLEIHGGDTFEECLVRAYEKEVRTNNGDRRLALAGLAQGVEMLPQILEQLLTETVPSPTASRSTETSAEQRMTWQANLAFNQLGIEVLPLLEIHGGDTFQEALTRAYQADVRVCGSKSLALQGLADNLGISPESLKAIVSRSKTV